MKAKVYCNKQDCTLRKTFIGDTGEYSRNLCCNTKCELSRDDSQHPSATISGWVARDSERAGNNLHFHRNEIKRGKFYWENKDANKPIGESLILPKDIFPFLTWESDPIEVEITIKPKKR